VITLRTSAVLVLLASALLVAQELPVELNNGLKIELLSGGEPAIASLALVCPVPGQQTPEDLAAMAIINELFWRGEVEGRQVQLAELVRSSERFDGTISTQLTVDGYIIHMSLPRQLLPYMAERLAELWQGVLLTPDTVQAARERVIGKYRQVTYSSVENQFTQRLQAYVWQDSDYQFPLHGNDLALEEVSIEHIRATWQRLIKPASWTLLIRGIDELTSEEMASLEVNLGDLAATAGQAFPAQEMSATLSEQLRVEIPANSTLKYAAIGYRVPGAAQGGVAVPQLLRNKLVRSQAYARTLEQLGPNATISVNLDMRAEGGMFYLFASWGSEVSTADATALLYGLIQEAPAEPSGLENARKATAMDFWTRYSSIDAYTLWRANLAIAGSLEDTTLSDLDAADAARVESYVEQYLNSSNSIILVTVPQ